MEQITRVDRGHLRAVRTDQGYLRADAQLTRSGVFEYRNPDGSVRREYRPESEVFRSDSVETLKLAPLTNGHPAPGLLDASNTKQYQIGTAGESLKRQGRWLVGPIVVTDGDALGEVDSGKVEVSLGYTAEFEPTPGVSPDGKRFDGTQRNIRYNHVALVEKGRASEGTERSRILLDAAEQMEESSNTPEVILKEKIKLGGVTFEVEPQLAEAYRADEQARQARWDELEQAKTEAEKERDKEKARADSAEEAKQETQTKLDEATKPEALQERVQQRLDLERKARLVLDAEETLEGLTDQQIKVKVIQKARPSVKLDEATEDYVNARFDHVIEAAEEQAEKKPGAAEKMRPAGNPQTRNDSPDREKARQKMLERYDSAWKREK